MKKIPSGAFSSIRVEIAKEHKRAKISLFGGIDENASRALVGLHSQVKEREVDFDFSHVEYVNSLGVRCWIHFLRTFQEGRDIGYYGCPGDIISQMNILPDFQGHGKIKSLIAEFSCLSCGHDDVKTFTVPKQPDALWEAFEKVACSSCGQLMEIDEDEEVFSFIFSAA